MQNWGFLDRLAIKWFLNHFIENLYKSIISPLCNETSMYEIPGFRTGDLSIEAWCSFACTNMSKKTDAYRAFLLLSGHESPPPIRNLNVL